jgi:ADP-ribose pyrophosphatase YjhB (NUDIX family)
MHVSEIFGVLKGHITTGQSETITSSRQLERETGVRAKLERMFTVVHNKLFLV